MLPFLQYWSVSLVGPLLLCWLIFVVKRPIFRSQFILWISYCLGRIGTSWPLIFRIQFTLNHWINIYFQKIEHRILSSSYINTTGYPQVHINIAIIKPALIMCQLICIDRMISIHIVVHVTNGWGILKNPTDNYRFLLCMFRRALCLTTCLLLVSIFLYVNQTEGRTSFSLGTWIIGNNS